MAAGETDPKIANAARNEQLKALLAACTLKDRRAFAQLYEMTSAKLYGVILRILIRDEWAQDCLQEAYIKIWNSAGSYRPYLASPITWMATIARNQALDLLRRRRREVQMAEPEKLLEASDSKTMPLERLQQSDEGRRLNDCLEQIKSQQRQVIALAYFKGLTHEELASQTGTPLGTVKTWIRRGLEQLKRCLEP
ncbi:MAG: RNA polymerase sigma factor [Gammaproteobacteria bacterium (ex Lamellibrachia satsuma)]|nr:MAG: sigma-70 family RNA polymerase sigma factor [Gammaproteobacteria bacterium (ex Lamellibrachia satsuma)]RRS32551.1 MAG: RNA polymerase sigma factor [Gammaproteobacteria bacterium (ex Lamellibrachia satsuma)]RRS36742.1 MAG: RNA polymerase sigma factor [Gammaproteobacteria bacterium (ex Lamellibrachia satsuma)]